MFSVLRLGHRHSRDKRITTHIALVSRLYGCNKFMLTSKDSAIANSINGVNERFGESTRVIESVSPKKVINEWKGKSVHLTMYGEKLDKLDEISSDEDILFIVGAEKVPAWVYHEADYNISVGNQPHSEVAALAIALYRIYGDNPLYDDRKGKMTIIPEKRGKNVKSSMD